MSADPLPEIELTLEQAAVLFQCAVSRSTAKPAPDMTQYNRCACPDPDPQPLPGSRTTICGNCGGWFSVSIFEMEDWTTFRRTYKDEPARPRPPEEDE